MTHYSSAQDTKTLISKAIVFAEKLKDIIDKNSDLTPYIVYTGMSGIALATALSMQYTMRYGEQLNMIYVRKPNEVTHGEILEINGSLSTGNNNLLIFVDDFIASGQTINRMLDTLKKEYFDTNCKHETLMLDAEECYRHGSFEQAGIRYYSGSNKYV